MLRNIGNQGLAFRGWRERTKKEEVSPEYEKNLLTYLTERVRDADHVNLELTPIDTFESGCSCSTGHKSCCDSANQAVRVEGTIFNEDNSTDDVELDYYPDSTQKNYDTSVYGSITTTSEDDTDEEHPIEFTDTLKLNVKKGKSEIVTKAAKDFVEAVRVRNSGDCE